MTTDMREKYPDAVGVLTRWTVIATGFHIFTISAETSYQALTEGFKRLGFPFYDSIMPPPSDMILEEDRVHVHFEMKNTTWTINAHRHVREGELLGTDELGEDYEWICCQGCLAVVQKAGTEFAQIDAKGQCEMNVCYACSPYYETDTIGL